MKKLRYLVPVLGVFALMALFLMLPETPGPGCKTCSSNDPYIPLIGAGYFSALIALSLLFPSFPGSHMARAGLIWSILLGISFTYIHLPGWCAPCLVAHGCHILIWTVWLTVPAVKARKRVSNQRERWCLMLFAPLSVVALFSCLNLTFMAYGFRGSLDTLGSGLRPGDKAPLFSTKTVGDRPVTNSDATLASGIIINFVSPGCVHCKEQLQVLNSIAGGPDSQPYRFINVSPLLSPELLQSSPAMEWVEDKEDHLRKLFKVAGYPTMFLVGVDGKIAQVIPGVPEQLKAWLTQAISRIPSE